MADVVATLDVLAALWAIAEGSSNASLLEAINAISHDVLGEARSTYEQRWAVATLAMSQLVGEDAARVPLIDSMGNEWSADRVAAAHDLILEVLEGRKT